ncbi:hypothetical protein L0F81_02850 [Streptomyces tricolor]|uniref:DUF7426 domain-containing protein n=1 Tax=Streptomyces tricolor TaxID=68277 RepID=A0ABS9J9K2_9ACTN|nr:hypothetical protein [Streptomyces tricolor]MCG0062235.1 hypothetical protein [Streptomyces tricolor]
MSGGNTFETLDAFLDEYLELPVRGRDGQVRVYRIEEPSAEDGLRIERITSLAARLAAGGKAPDAPVLGDEEELDLYRMCLGSAYEKLRTELKWGAFKHVALTAMFWVTTDADTARQFWKTGQQPGKAPRNRAERRQASRDSSASAAASTTPSPASTSGTRAASQPRRRAKRRRPQT